MKAYCMENDMLVALKELEVIPNEPQFVWCGPSLMVSYIKKKLLVISLFTCENINVHHMSPFYLV